MTSLIIQPTFCPHPYQDWIQWINDRRRKLYGIFSTSGNLEKADIQNQEVVVTFKQEKGYK